MPIRSARGGGAPPLEWRFRRGWSEAELKSRLRRVDPLGASFPPAADMTAELGWNEVRSCAVIAREPPGSPVAGGAFERARELVAALEHSDPRLAVAHFDPAAPLLQRPVLVEIRAGGLRFLCPSAVARVREAATAAGATWGFALDTLRGHLARGRAWFVVEKDAASGEVRFRIHGAWRAGDLPKGWGWLGWQLLGRRRQRAWHRLSHARLRRLVAEGAEQSARGLLAHSGRRVAAGPNGVAARPVGAAVAAPDREEERMRWDRWALVAGFAALAGARSMSAPALVALAAARARPRDGGGVARALSSRVAAVALGACALAEMAADKWPRIPPRTAPPSLALRALSGAASADALAAAPGPGWRCALVGAAVAAGATFASSRLRRLLARGVREPAAGFAEDALVLAAGGAMLRWMGALPGRARVHATGMA
jgi:uncharacterized membrane protein